MAANSLNIEEVQQGPSSQFRKTINDNFKNVKDYLEGGEQVQGLAQEINELKTRVTTNTNQITGISNEIGSRTGEGTIYEQLSGNSTSINNLSGQVSSGSTVISVPIGSSATTGRSIASYLGGSKAVYSNYGENALTESDAKLLMKPGDIYISVS